MAKKPTKALKDLHRAERKLTRKANKHRHKPAVKVAGTLSEVADQPPLVAINLATVAAGVLLRKPALFRAGLRMLAAHALATGMKSVIKGAVDRTRPDAAIEGKGDRLGKGRSKHHDHNSFPSGHTAGAVAVAAAVAREAPAAAPYAYGTAGTIAAIQVPRASHYVSDVVVGALIGWLSERVVDGVITHGEAVLEKARQPARVT